jgi:hypothetical protein
MNPRRLALCAILFGIALLALPVIAAPIELSIAAQVPCVSTSNALSSPFEASRDRRTLKLSFADPVWVMSPRDHRAGFAGSRA